MVFLEFNKLVRNKQKHSVQSLATGKCSALNGFMMDWIKLDTKWKAEHGLGSQYSFCSILMHWKRSIV
jgi:hypothetical protein